MIANGKFLNPSILYIAYTISNCDRESFKSIITWRKENTTILIPQYNAVLELILGPQP